tara:strand:- start:3454 stop:4020 length:567 start_codon:yes stop_codon:yes gene_type:complete
MQDVNDILNNNNENENENNLSIYYDNNQYEELIQNVISEFRKSHVDIKLQREEIEHIIENFEKKNYELKKLSETMHNDYIHNNTNFHYESIDCERILATEMSMKTEKQDNEIKIKNKNYQIVKYEPIIENILQQEDIQIKLKRYYGIKQYNRDFKSHIKMDQIVKHLPNANDVKMTNNEIINKISYYK